ncbi:DUF4384 domain-containing protein [Anianabacter salinae]|uniref:DUF4384 domain-containing protein n=1 Tax=Anianabacter salinae TaxID=2851023 RepID=UPI00225E2AF8|nr:DUF4384 domain-containing protein [Anianabacter salinae]MBV0914194.1 DUF4384 domain-containing protein [Anianabacter salinae]
MIRFLRPLALSLIVAGSAAAANDAMPLPADATPDEAAAYAVLDKHCARCHQDGALKDGLTKAKSGFGHVLDIRRLAEDAKFVTQGEARASKLHTVIGPYSFPSMPDDCTEDACFPAPDEIATIGAWIDGLKDAAPPPRKFLPLPDLFAMAHQDLLAQPTNRRDRVRYLSLRVLHNDQNVSLANLDGYRAATVKLLNALSWNPVPYQPQWVDEEQTLMRVFLPDLDWDAATWERLAEVYPYGMTSPTDPNLRPLQSLAGTGVPVLRADWFAATAPVSPLYYDLLGLPDTVAGLEAKLGLNMLRNIRDEQVVRAGFQDSGVSTHNRLIERHPLGTGFFWTSYDFAGSQGRQSFFEYPLGPVEAFGETHAFLHDGGESIFTLPNGFHAYYLNTADGVRLDVGPTQIVRDDDYTDGTGEVVNGISCISCHSKGIRLNEDRVRDVAMADLSLPPDVRQTIDAIYPGQDEVARWMERDTQAFLGTLASAGLDPEIKAGGLEPVRGLFVYHVDLFVNFAQAANELGLTEDELRARAGFVGAEMASLLLRLDQSPIARDEWTAVYPAMLERVTDYRPLPHRGQGSADLSYSVAQAVGADYQPPAQDAGYDPAAHSLPVSGHLTVYTDKPTYKVGEGLKIIVEPRQDCRLTLINIDDQRRSCVLYPHPGLPDVPIKGGTQYVFPPQGSLRTSAPGVETILAICNAADAAIADVQRDTSRVSCDASARSVDYDAITYDSVVNEVLALDLSSDDRTAGNGTTYRALSSQNPDVAKAQVSATVTEY